MLRRPLHLSSTRSLLGAGLLGLVLLGATAAPASALRVVTYNLLNYDNQFSNRDPHFRTVIAAMPGIDVLAVQEVQDATAMNRFLTNVLNVVEPGQWAVAQFFNDPAQSFNQGLFYRISTVDVVAADTLGNAPRDICYYTLRPDGYSSAGAEITIFVTHFKAGSSSADQSTRFIEARRLRSFMNDNFPIGSNLMVVGDFNMRSSTESAYQRLIQVQVNNIGQLQDPINLSGTWNNNGSAAYTVFHTQSPRIDNLGDGGATGGMDDRFDFLLPSYPLDDQEGFDQLSATYRTFGNDGLHFNNRINAAPVIPEGQAIADALHAATDHLPVILDFQIPPKSSAVASLDFGSAIVGGVSEETLEVTNAAGAPADELDYSLTVGPGFTAPFGNFQAAAGESNGHTISMATAIAGVKSRNLTVDSDDPDTPSLPVQLSGTVLRHAAPSLADTGFVDADTLDFGSAEAGLFADQAVSVANLEYDSLQALLEVYDAQFTGGEDRFGFVGGFAAAEVGSTPAVFTVTFDDSGAARDQDTTYTATLIFSTRDEQGLAGATDLASLTVTILATVLSQSQIATPDPDSPVRTLLGANYPNPFTAGTAIRFEIVRSAVVTLTVFDVQGRRIRTLHRGWTEAGRYELAWDGRNEAGVPVRNGVYFYRLDTPDRSLTRRMIKLR